MTFNQWLKKQVDRDDPTGDLAQDFSRDNRPTPPNTLNAWKRHLQNAHASVHAIEALQEAWEEYECQ